MVKAWLAITAVASVLLPAAADAAMFKVRNCTTVRIEAWAYNVPDVLRISPYKVTVLESRGQGMVVCQTPQCSTVYHPAGGSPFSVQDDPVDFCLVQSDRSISGKSWFDPSCEQQRCGTIQ